MRKRHQPGCPCCGPPREPCPTIEGCGCAQLAPRIVFRPLGGRFAFSIRMSNQGAGWTGDDVGVLELPVPSAIPLSYAYEYQGPGPGGSGTWHVWDAEECLVAAWDDIDDLASRFPVVSDSATVTADWIERERVAVLMQFRSFVPDFDSPAVPQQCFVRYYFVRIDDTSETPAESVCGFMRQLSEWERDNPTATSYVGWYPAGLGSLVESGAVQVATQQRRIAPVGVLACDPPYMITDPNASIMGQFTGGFGDLVLQGGEYRWPGRNLFNLANPRIQGAVSNDESDQPESCFPVQCPEDFCRRQITVASSCPETCAGGQFRFRHVATGKLSPVYTAVVETGTESPCVRVVWSGRACVPPGGGEVEIIRHPSGDVLRTLDLDDECDEPHVEVEGDSAASFRVKLCVDGCPEGRLLDASARVRVIDGSGVQRYSTGLSTGSGCLEGLVTNPGPGSYTLRMEVSTASPGYELATFDFPIVLEEPGEECQEFDLGVVELGPDANHVCTCAGIVPRCLAWAGNGSVIVVSYDEAEGAWIGLELVTGEGIVSDGAFCLDEAGFGTNEDVYMPVRLEIRPDGEGCVIEATRWAPYCLCGGDFAFPPCFAPPCTDAGGLIGTPRLAGWDPVGGPPVDFRTGVSAAPIASPWGPANPFPGVNLTDWTRPNGDPDPNACYAPARAYSAAFVTASASPLDCQ